MENTKYSGQPIIKQILSLSVPKMFIGQPQSIKVIDIQKDLPPMNI